MKRILMSGAVMLALCLAFGGAAKADTFETVFLNLTNGFTTCTPNCAQVFIDVNTGGTSATLTFTSLLSGFQFDTVGFNSNDATISVTGGPLKNNPPNAQDGFGKFGYVVDTGINGGSTGSSCNGTTGDADCNFIVTITGTGLTLSNFHTLSIGGDSVFFAGHIASDTCTGFVGGGGGATDGTTGGTCGTTSTPEPGSLSMLGIGLLAIGGFARRRFLTN